MQDFLLLCRISILIVKFIDKHRICLRGESIMKALFLEKPREFRLMDIPRIDEKDKVTIKVKAVGICGTEISCYKGVFPFGTYPRTLGHEVAGEVVSVPDNNNGIKVGDKVALEPYRYCGSCYPCSLGRTNCCEELKVIGVHANGAYMEYFSHEPHLIHKVPDTMSWEQAAMVEPLTISIHSVHRAGVKKGEHVAIPGAGPIGLLAAEYALYLGAIPIVIDPMEKRLELAKSLGIKYTFNPMTQDIIKEIAEITSGRMAEAVIEASGSASAVRSSIDYVSYAGRISLVGIPKDDIPLPTFLFTKKELDVRGSRNSAKEFPLAIELISQNKINVKSLISNIIEFEELPNYYKSISENPNEYLKVIAKL